MCPLGLASVMLPFHLNPLSTKELPEGEVQKLIVGAALKFTEKVASTSPSVGWPTPRARAATGAARAASAVPPRMPNFLEKIRFTYSLLVITGFVRTSADALRSLRHLVPPLRRAARDAHARSRDRLVRSPLHVPPWPPLDAPSPQ